MSQLVRSGCIYFAMFSMNPVIAGHIPEQQALAMSDGLLHVITEPSHLSIVMFVVLLLIVLIRHKVVSFTEWYLRLINKG